MRTSCSRQLPVAIGLVMALSLPAAAQQIVSVSLPTAVGFTVTNVGQSAAGSPNPSPVTFAVISLLPTRALRISVKADGNFTPPSGPAIPASNVSWTTTNASGGSGSAGTLSTATYSQVFQTSTGLLGSGGVSVHWTLAPPGGAIRAGSHALTVRWRLEAVVP